MSSPHVRRLAAAVVLAVTGGVAVAQAVRPSHEIEERTAARVMTLRVRIRPTWSADPGSCLALAASDLDVRLRGDPVDADRVELDRRRERAIHALLIDTSGSMANSMDRVRDAAAEYVRRLDPEREQAMVVTFDDSVLLEQPATSDRQRLLGSIAAIRPGDSTALNDALCETVQELRTRRERAVIVLLTDGVDTASLHERDDVIERVRAHPDLTIFPIGFDLPEITAMGPSGLASIRGFLQKLARRTSGRYVVASDESRVDDAFRRIREMLESEAVLRVEDPDPIVEPGKVSVSSRVAGCRVDVLREMERPDDPWLRPLAPPFDDLPRDFAVPPDPRYDGTPEFRAFRRTDPVCETATGDGADDAATPRARAELERIHGCLLDVIMDQGVLYDPFAPSGVNNWLDWNGYLKTRIRPFELKVPALAALPDRPERLIERMAALALEAADDEVERAGRKKPIDWHARPYQDLLPLVNGRTFFDLRIELARALFAYPDYRHWVLDTLRAETERDLDDLRERYRRRVPGATPAELEAALEQSEEGRAIRARTGRPAPGDLARLLAAWLGDLPAHDWFVSWEAERLDDRLAGRESSAGAADFLARWGALRRLLFVPSYVRELTLLMPVHDRTSDRIGFYRIVLPRAGWIEPRLRNYRKHPGWSDLPLDLLPELPMAYLAMQRLLDDHPGLAKHLEQQGYRVRSLRYASRMKPHKRTPAQAFRETRVGLVLGSGDFTATLDLDLSLGATSGADVELAGIRGTVDGDPTLAALVAELSADSEREQVATLDPPGHEVPRVP